MPTKLCYDGIRDSRGFHFAEKWRGKSIYDWHLNKLKVWLSRYDFDIRVEGECNVPEGETIVVLPITTYGGNYNAIVLVPSKGRADEYQRIGLLEMESKHFENAEPAVFLMAHHRCT